VAVVVVLVGAGLVARGLAGAEEPRAGCTGSTTITVAAGGHFAVLDDLARRWTADRPAVDGQCIRARVVRKSPGEVAAALGPEWDEARDGPRPDVWAADSTLWLRFAASRPEAAPLVPEQPTSIASSPVVLALHQPMAAALGWPRKVPSLEEAVGAFVARDTWSRLGHPEWATLKMGTSEPTASTAGLASTFAFLDQDGNGELSNAEFTASLAFSQVLDTIAPDTAIFFDELRGAQPGAGPTVAAFPAVERDLAAYLADSPAVPLVPVYAKQGVVVADYPYAVLNAGWVDGVRRAAADRFLRYLLGPVGREAFGAEGFRDPGHRVEKAPGLRSDLGFQAELPPLRPAPNAATVGQLLTDWTALQRPSNILVVLDVSGSMNSPVPGVQATRLQLLKQTASAGFGLLTNRTSVGLWAFSSRLTPTTDYRELVPFGSLKTPVGSVPRVQALLGAVAGLQAGGGTALYDTTYAAFRAMQDAWRPNENSLVLLITDGKNEADTGLSRAELISRLTREARPDRPTQVISFAVGPEADADALQEISRVTGGRTFVARDPASAVQTLVLAFAGRLR
jgi:Ca-activated chloride channel homolog